MVGMSVAAFTVTGHPGIEVLMGRKKSVRVTETKIGGTVYIVESVESESARSTVYDKVKKLIQNDIKSQQFQG